MTAVGWRGRPFSIQATRLGLCPDCSQRGLGKARLVKGAMVRICRYCRGETAILPLDAPR